jgi:dienelactone hydrolase
MRTAAVLQVVLLVLVGCAGTRVEFPATPVYPPASGKLVADVFRPDRPGPLPAVVLLGPCGGVTDHEYRWAALLRDRGYAAVVVQSLASRGVSNVCRGEVPQVSHVARDALAALRWLSLQPGVDATRVGVMGWSHGGGAALDVSRLSARDNDFEGWPRFKAAVAYYPPCQFADVLTNTPTLILLAEQDDWTPPGSCQGVERDAKSVSTRMYQGAMHGFDQPGPMRVYLGHRMAYDPTATSSAMQESLVFLDRELRGR